MYHLFISTTTMVVRTRLNITLYIYCLSCCHFAEMPEEWLLRNCGGEVGFSIRKSQDRGLTFVIAATKHRIS